MIQLNHNDHSVSINNKREHLTPKEWAILAFLMEHPNQMFTAKQIYQCIWKETPFDCEGVVAVHLRHIREKIEKNPSKPEYIQSLWGCGYRFVQETIS